MKKQAYVEPMESLYLLRIRGKVETDSLRTDTLQNSWKNTEGDVTVFYIREASNEQLNTGYKFKTNCRALFYFRVWLLFFVPNVNLKVVVNIFKYI